MTTPKIQGLGIVQDGFTKRWKATDEVEALGWLEAWGSTLIEAMEALQARAAKMAMKEDTEEEDT